MGRKHIQCGILIVLGVIVTCVFSAVFHEKNNANLVITFLNVGQGDAVFIQSPTKRQILIDGGPDRSVLRELHTVMPWYDRSIDMVVATHPDSDHIAGLIGVFERYHVSHVVQSGGSNSESPAARLFEEAVEKESATRVIARRGQHIEIGGGAFIDILFPDRDVDGLETNNSSIVARLVYGETSVMLTGDAPRAIESYLVRLDGKRIASSVLKAGHHGSRTSTGELFMGYVNPSYIVFSRGCDNSYGHPHAETLAIAEQFDAIKKDTCRDGRISFTSNGVDILPK